MRFGPPGWEPHKITTRIDGWVVDPDNEDRIPAAVVRMMAHAMPQPGEIEIIRARMIARQRVSERGWSCRMTDQTETHIETDEDDQYYKMLTLFGRSEDADHRIAIHESGHAVAARLLGNPLGGATINPDPDGKYGGLVWGPGYSVAYGEHDAADRVSDICSRLREVMPKDGEPRGDAADIYMHALNRCIELVAAASAERMLLPGDPVPSTSDIEHTIQYATLVCRSPEAAAKFISLAEQMADDLLQPYGPVIIALSIVLKIRRTLTGAEIDDVIKTVMVGLELALEQRRRADWQKRALSAKKFEADHRHAADATVP